jgi:hypothetical protein
MPLLSLTSVARFRCIRPEGTGVPFCSVGTALASSGWATSSEAVSKEFQGLRHFYGCVDRMSIWVYADASFLVN